MDNILRNKPVAQLLLSDLREILSHLSQVLQLHRILHVPVLPDMR